MVPLQLPPLLLSTCHCATVVGSPGTAQGPDSLEKGQEGKGLSRATSVMDPLRLRHALGPGEPRFGSTPGLL